MCLSALSEQAFHSSVFLYDGEFRLGIERWDIDADGVVVAVEHIGVHSVCLLLLTVKYASYLVLVDNSCANIQNFFDSSFFFLDFLNLGINI